MARRQEDQPRQVGYVGEPVKVSFPTEKDPAVQGNFARVSGERAQQLDAVVASIARGKTGGGPVNDIVGRRLGDYWEGITGANNDELAYVVHALAERGLKVQWNGSEHIVYRADEEDDSDD